MAKTHLKINPEKRADTIPCEICREKLYPADIVEQYRDVNAYPYEGLMDVFLCPKCGRLTIVPEDNRVFTAIMENGEEKIVRFEEVS